MFMTLVNEMVDDEPRYVLRDGSLTELKMLTEDPDQSLDFASVVIVHPEQVKQHWHDLNPWLAQYRYEYFCHFCKISPFCRSHA